MSGDSGSYQSFSIVTFVDMKRKVDNQTAYFFAYGGAFEFDVIPARASSAHPVTSYLERHQNGRQNRKGHPLSWPSSCSAALMSLPFICVGFSTSFHAKLRISRPSKNVTVWQSDRGHSWIFILFIAWSTLTKHAEQCAWCHENNVTATACEWLNKEFFKENVGLIWSGIIWHNSTWGSSSGFGCWITSHAIFYRMQRATLELAFEWSRIILDQVVLNLSSLFLLLCGIVPLAHRSQHADSAVNF